MAEDVTQKFGDFLLRHQHYLYRVENATIKDMQAPYKAAKQDIYNKLVRLQETPPKPSNIPAVREFRIARLENQLAEINNVLGMARAESVGALQSALGGVADLENMAYAKMLGDEFSKIGIDIMRLPYEQINFILEKPLIYQHRGLSIPEYSFFKDQEFVSRIRRDLTQSIIQGEDMARATRRLVNPATVGLTGLAEKELKNYIKIVARSEIQHVSNSVNRAIYDANQDVLKGVVYTATLDRRTCIRCASLDTRFYGFKKGNDHNGPLLPLHPFCFIDHQIPIYTSKGYKHIGKIEVGDLVLTHKGRFRPVTELIRHKQVSPKVITIEVQYPKLGSNPKFKPHRKKLTLTTNHPVFVNGKWVEAGNVKQGDKIRHLASKCKRCGKLIPDDKKYCSASCNSKDITDRQWADPKHRKNISAKNRESTLRQYTDGKRDPIRVTKKARQAVKEKLFDNGLHPFQTGACRGKVNKALKLPEVRAKISESKMGDKNPMRMYPELARQNGKKMKAFWLANPDKHPNRIMSKKGFESSLEKTFREELETRGFEFEKQHPIDRYFVDFAFPELKIAIEIDGDYWHQDKEADLKRQQEIESFGWDVFRYAETQVVEDVASCVDEIDRIVNNHSGNYEFMNLEVVGIKIWANTRRAGKSKAIFPTTLYNFSVEEDESYIANGIVVHNCRCTYIPITKSWKELGSKRPEIIDAKGKAPFTGNVWPRQSYDEWLRKQPVEFQEDVLGPARYKMWKDGDLPLKKMATTERTLTIPELEDMVERGKISAPSPLERLTTKVDDLVLPAVDFPEEWAESTAGEMLAAYKQKILDAADEVHKAALAKQVTVDQAGELLETLVKKDNELFTHLTKQGYFSSGGHVGQFAFHADMGIKLTDNIDNVLVLRMKNVHTAMKGLNRQAIRDNIDEINVGIKALDDYIVHATTVQELGYKTGESYTALKKYVDEFGALRQGKKVDGTDIHFIANRAKYEKVLNPKWVQDWIDEMVDPSLLSTSLADATPEAVAKLVAATMPDVASYAKYVDKDVLSKLLLTPGPLTKSQIDDAVGGVIKFIDDLKALEKTAIANNKTIDDVVSVLNSAPKAKLDELPFNLPNVYGNTLKLHDDALEMLNKKGVVAGLGGETTTDLGQLMSLNKFNKLFEATSNTLQNQVMKKLGVKGPNYYTKSQKLKWYVGSPEQKNLVIAEVDDKISSAAKKSAAKQKANKELKPAQSPKIETVPDGQPFDFTAVDEAWEVQKPLFKKDVELAKNIKGAHTKYFAYDNDGGKWLFKPYSREPFRAYADEMSYKIGRLIDPDAIEVRVRHTGGMPGSIQKWKTGVTDLSDDIFSYSDDTIRQLQREHVVDWMIGNHDAHGDQFLTNGKKLWGVDKGQAGKHIGKEKLSVHFHPNSAFGAREPVYNAMYKAAAKGKYKIDPNETLKTIKKVEQISDETFVAVVRPYAEARVREIGGDVDEIIGLFLKKKANLRNDFEAFFTEAYGKPFKFKGANVEAVKGLDDVKKLTAKQAKDLRDARIVGKALKRDFEDIEDLNVLIWLEKNAQGEDVLAGHFKMTQKARLRVTNKLKKQAGDLNYETLTGLPEDFFYDDIANAVKTIRFHKDDFAFNQTSIDAAVGRRYALEELLKSTDKNVQDMARHYLSYLDKIDAVMRLDPIALPNSVKLVIKELEGFGKLNKYVPKPKATTKATNLSYTVNTRRTTYKEKNINKGQAKVANETTNTPLGLDGTEYVVTFDDGSEIVIWGTDYTRSAKGTVQFYSKNLEPDEMFRKLEQIGINTSKVTDEYEEIMYLWQQTYTSGLEKNATIQTIMKLDDQKEKLDRLRKFWSNQLNVADVTKLPKYNPKGYANHFGQGYYRRSRFDGLSDLFPDETLHHSFGGMTNEEALNIILDSGGKISSRTERYRLGQNVNIANRGQSGGKDMKDGGGQYLFTHKFRKSGTQATTDGVWFKRHTLDRMDANWYDWDSYGQTQHRDHRWLLGKEQIKHAHIDQVTLKNGGDLWSDAQYWVVRDIEEKQKMMAIMKQHGFDKMPDGRKLDEFFIARGDQWDW